MANDGTVKIGVEFENTDKEIAALKSQLSGISKAATTSLTTVTSLTKTAITGTLKAITAAGTAAGGFIAYGTSYNSQIEQFQTSFEVMSGSAQKAAETIETLKKMGAATPFELPDLAETTQLLMNYGFTADDAISKMSMLGDIAQGDSEKMKRIATAYGQMSSAGKVMLEDIRQMVEAGFNPLQEISQATGESMESLYARISAGELTVEEITASIQRSTSEGGKYFQSMEKQSKTAAGQISTLKDNFQQLAGAIAGDTSSALSEEFLPLLNEMIGTLQTAFEQGGLDGLAEAFGDSLAQLVVIAAEKIPSLMAMGSDVIASIAQGIRDNADAIFDSFLEVLMSLPGFVVENLGILLDVGSIFITKLCDVVINNADELADTAVDTVVMLGNFLIKNAPKLAKAAKELIKALAKAIGNQVPALKPFTKVIEGLADNLDTLLPIILGVVGGFKGMKIIKSITPLVSGFVTQAKNAVTQGGLLNGVLGAFSSPASAVVSILGGIVTGIGSMVAAHEAAERAKIAELYEEWTREATEAKEAVEDFTQSNHDLAVQTEEAAAATNAEYGQLEKLQEELDGLVDANGRIKQGYEDRANYIVNELNEAYGEEILKIEDGVIPEYDKLKGKINEVIEAKKLMALSDTYNEQYTDALADQEQLPKLLATQETVMRDSQNRYQEIVDDYLAAIKTGDTRLYNYLMEQTGGTATVEDAAIWKKYINSDELDAEIDAMVSNISEASEQIDTIMTDALEADHIIEMYEKGEEARLNGQLELAKEYYAKINDFGIATLQSAEATAEEKLAVAETMMLEQISAVKIASAKGDEEMKQSAYDAMDDIFEELEKTGIDGELALTEPVIDGLLALGDEVDLATLIDLFGLAGTDSGKLYAAGFKTEYDRLMSELQTQITVTANVIGKLGGFIGGSGSGSTSNTSTTYNTTNHNYIHSTPSAAVEAERQAELRNKNNQGVGK